MLDIERHGAVLRLTLNRPDRRNALGSEMIEALDKALREAACDSAVGAVVVDGAPPGFCAGSDLKELQNLNATGKGHHEARTGEISRSIAALDKPVVAAVAGFAIGGGCFLAASCDLVFTAADSRWHLPLIARVGLAKARRLTLATAPIDGRMAERMGLADTLVEMPSSPRSVTDAALAEADRLARMPRHAVLSSKRFFAALGDDAKRIDKAATRFFIGDCTVAQDRLKAGKGQTRATSARGSSS
jgi:enoyl-CoA hydratase/carnithine racemase